VVGIKYCFFEGSVWVYVPSLFRFPFFENLPTGLGLRPTVHLILQKNIIGSVVGIGE
jgi:hypothetical protein